MNDAALNPGEKTALWIVALLMGRFTMLPELMDFFAYDAQKVLEFIDRFGGMSLVIPGRQEVGRMARDINIYRALTAAKNAENVKRLASLYGVTQDRVRAIFSETSEALEALDKQSGFDSSVIRTDV